MNQATAPCYRMGFTVGAHSARHMRHILHTYLTTWGLSALADSAELALTELSPTSYGTCPVGAAPC